MKCKQYLPYLSKFITCRIETEVGRQENSDACAV